MNLRHISCIVVYITSTIIVAAEQTHSRLNSDLLTSLQPDKIPAKFHQYQYPQSIIKYCYLYGTCPMCCKKLYDPRFTTGLTGLEILPAWDSFVSSRKGLENTRSLDNYTNKKNLSVFAQLVDYYKRVPQITSQHNGALLTNNNLPPAKTTLKQSKELSNSFKHLNIKADSTNMSEVLKNILIKSRRRNYEANGSMAFTKIVIKPLVSEPHTTNHMQIAINHILNTTEQIQRTISRLQSTSDHLLHTTDDIRKTIKETQTPTSHITDSMKNTRNHALNSNEDEAIKLNTSTSDFYNYRILSHHLDDKAHGDFIFEIFRNKLDQVERKFLLSVFKKLSAISPEDRRENGISFLQSGFFLYQLLLALSITMDQDVTKEIEDFLDINMTEAEKLEILERTVSWLPKTSDVLKFRWSLRLVMQRQTGDRSGRRTALLPPLQLSWLHGNETPAELTDTLNNMVLSDSGGSMHDTFEEEEVGGGVCAAALGTACARGAWRAAPTLLNDSLPFRDAPSAPNRTSRFFRLNDIMAYSYLHEWDAEAIEISYATPGLTLLLLVPKEPSLRPLVERATRTSLQHVVGVMRPMRLAVTLPLYTLRMTLLLPNKLQDMGMPSLVTNGTGCRPMKLSHAVQRLMFWAEAGRNAFKDDGIEWDPRPELEIVVDRPYLFFVRWQNITIMNGVFAL